MACLYQQRFSAAPVLSWPGLPLSCVVGRADCTRRKHLVDGRGVSRFATVALAAVLSWSDSSSSFLSEFTSDRFTWTWQPT